MISLITSSTTDPRPIAQTHDWRLCLRRLRQSYALIDRLINTLCHVVPTYARKTITSPIQ